MEEKIVLIILVMFLLGIILGFIGAGGAGFVIALLTILFHVPIHTALGTSLAGMAFTSLSGAFSHYREGNIQMKIGLIVGVFAAFGSFFGARLTSLIPADLLHYLTAGMLFLSALLILVRLFIVKETHEDSGRRRTRLCDGRICRLYTVGQSADRHDVRRICRSEIHQPRAESHSEISHLFNTGHRRSHAFILN